jgi:hypothetical protein
MDGFGDYLTVDQAAAALSYTPGYVRKLVHRGLLAPAVRWPNRLLLFAPVEVARYASSHRKRGRPRKPPEGAPDA